MLCCRCDDYTSSQPQDATPAAMLALDLWLPPSYHVDTWGLLDAGQLGPALRWSYKFSYLACLGCCKQTKTLKIY